MARVLTNSTSLQVARQEAFNTLGASPSWELLEPNGSITFGASIKTEARKPISKNRQRRKGSTVDLDSEVGFEADLTLDALLRFADGFCFARPVNYDLTFRAAPATGTSDVFTVPALTAAQAGKLQWVSGGAASLLWAVGYVNGGNNGLHVLSADPATSGTSLTVAASTLVTETPPANAEVSVCGIRASADDLSITVSAGIATLTSAADINFTTIGLTVGQTVHIGGVTGANQFSAGAGFARVRTLAAATATFDNLDADLATDTGSGETVDLLFGRFVRNVTVGSSEFLEQYYQFEAGFEDLYETTPPTPVANPDGFEYALDNLANQLVFGFPLTNLAKFTPGFIGTDTEPAVDNASRKTNAATPLQPLFTAPFNTSADYARLRIADADETGLTTDFKDWTLTLNNNGSGEKVQGFLGSKFINTGSFDVGIEGTLLFTSPLVTARIRSNATIQMGVIMQNSDGAFALDIPAGTLGDGSRDYAINESVKVKLALEAFQHPTLGTSIGISFFPVTPTSYAAA